VQEPSGILGPLTAGDVDRVVAAIDRDGYHVFAQRLSPQLCGELLSFALSTPSTPMAIPGMGGATGANGNGCAPRAVVFDREKPASLRQEFDTQSACETEAAQKILADPGLLAIAQQYLGFNPVLDLVAMWWSAAGFEGGRSEAAQLYHFDMDRVRFLKFFFYLTDVTPENGPHCYVRGSHRRKPRALLRDGRIPDEKILAHYDPADVTEICGPAGTIVAADTRGFHKGKPLVRGDRLMFQVQFADALFGQNYPSVKLNDRFGEGFTRFARQYGRTYSNFVS
jgi:hypothetical protein